MYKKLFLPVFLTLFLIATYLDLKYKGLFYRLLPGSVQAYCNALFEKE